MTRYKVYIDDILLKDLPQGIGDYRTNFVRDSEIFGIYVQNVLNLVFVGDGYCKLEETYRLFQDCEVNFEIKQSCNGGAYETLFLGSIPAAKIKVDYTNKTAEAEIQDRSPLSLISQFADSIFNFEATEDVFGNTLQTTATIGNFDLFDELGNPYTSRFSVKLSSAIPAMVSYMTGRAVTFTSDFFADIDPTIFNEWEVEWTTPPGVNQDTTIVFKRFDGTVVTRNVVSSGATHVSDVMALFVAPSPVPVTAGDVRSYMRGFKFNNFAANNVTLVGGTLNSFDTIEIISITTIGTGVVTFQQNTPFTDGVRNLNILNYNMLRGSTDGHDFRMTFKELMTNLNKRCNAYFIATFVGNDINIRLEDSSYFDAFTQTLTIDNAKDMTSEFYEGVAYSSMSASDNAGIITQLNQETVYSSGICGVVNEYNGESDFINDSVQIWLDLDNPAEEDNDSIYFIQGNASNDNATAAIQMFFEGTTINYYNPFLSNEHALRRHFNKFKGDLTSSPNFYYINTSPIKRFKKYEFTATITQAEYDTFIDEFVDNINFKTKEMTTYFTGVIMEANYNKNNGEAQFTVLGQ